MLVTEKMAREAVEVLGLKWPSPGDEPWTAETVNAAYRAKARETHPDAGGTAEDFANVDRAKHILLEWLKKPREEAPVHKQRKCDSCEGRGYIVISSGRIGSAGLRRQCRKCHGTGDADLDTHGLH